MKGLLIVVFVLIYDINGMEMIRDASSNESNGGRVAHKVRFDSDLNNLVVDRDTGNVSLVPLSFRLVQSFFTFTFLRFQRCTSVVEIACINYQQI